MLDIVNQGRRVQERLKALVRLNIELAKVEGKQKATFLGIAAGLGVAAALLVLYALGFIFAAAAAGLDEAVPLWLALLLVAILLLAGAAVAGYIAVRYAKKLQPPVQAIEEAKQTVATVESHV